MNLRQKWDEHYRRERQNIYDPDCFTQEDQIEMFSKVMSGRGSGIESQSSSRNGSTHKDETKKKKLIRDLNSLPKEEAQEIMRILMT